MKILIHCAGSFSHGLDSPERGESRWAQNIARLLGENGYKVFASSGGNPKNGDGRPSPNVKLINTRDERKHGPYDLYIDSCWWEGKSVPQSRYYFRVHWQLEERLRSSLPSNHFIIYPYNDSKDKFINDVNQNVDRTFFLPTPFCKEFSEPQIGNKGLLWPQRPEDVLSRKGEFPKNAEYTFSWAIDNVKNNKLEAHWLFSNLFSKYSGKGFIIPDSPLHIKYESVPYNKVLEVFNKCKLNLAVNLPSCSIDCAAAGAATAVWETGSWFNFVEVARKHNVLIPKSPSEEQVKSVLDTLMYNDEVFVPFVKDFQHIFRHHTEKESLRIFKEIESKL